jgi:hypothetical protein
MQRAGQDLTIAELISICGLDERFIKVFNDEKLTSLKSFR